jgi:hypothetical protein
VRADSYISAPDVTCQTFIGFRTLARTRQLQVGQTITRGMARFACTDMSGARRSGVGAQV